jgi:Phage integrase protein
MTSGKSLIADPRPPRTSGSTAEAQGPGRLGAHHFAYLRAAAEGVDLASAARRYLAIEHGAQAVTAHRQVLDRVAALARRRGDSRWRLLGLTIVDPSNAGAWAESEGLDGWSEAELQAMYVERFGQSAVGKRRRQARNARLREKRLALLRELEAVAAERAAPTDLIAGWLAPELAGQLRRAGQLTLADLQQRIARGGRWLLGLRAFGPVKAKRLADQVELLLGAPVPVVWAAPIAAGIDELLSGRQGANRDESAAVGIDALDDHAAVRAWIAARAGSPATAKQYEREAERFFCGASWSGARGFPMRPPRTAGRIWIS